MPINYDIPGAELVLFGADEEMIVWYDFHLSYSFGQNYTLDTHEVSPDEEPHAEMFVNGGNLDIFDAYAHRLFRDFPARTTTLTQAPFLRPDVEACISDEVQPLWLRGW